MGPEHGQLRTRRSRAYEPESVLFIWHEQKLALFVDFDDLP
jgi:hypothetical protein